jgi:hypothetical protein
MPTKKVQSAGRAQSHGGVHVSKSHNTVGAVATRSAVKRKASGKGKNHFMNMPSSTSSSSSLPLLLSIEPTINTFYYATEEYGHGQSFTMPETAMVGKITTTCLRSNYDKDYISLALDSLRSCKAHIREFVNDNSTESHNNALSGTILATGTCSVVESDVVQSYNETFIPPITCTFNFDYLNPNYQSLTQGQKYVVEWVIPSPRRNSVHIYIEDSYAGGKGYDINGQSLYQTCLYPLKLYGIVS